MLQDLQLLVQGGFGLIRVFGADDADTGVVLRTIEAHGLDLKMQLGIWIAGPKATHDAANQAQIVPAFTAWRQAAVPENQRAAAMMDTMIGKARADYAAVKATMERLGYHLPITIGETGWKAAGPQADRIHPVNQKMYLDRLAAWKDGPRQIFYFEAFDEPWKGDDDGWGLFDVNRKPRCAVQPLYPPALHDGPGCDPAQAVYWKRP